MARKKVDYAAAKAAKQKKIAIVGAVLFLGLLAFSVPKTLKMLHPKHSATKPIHAYSATATPATTSTASGVPTTPVSTTSAGATVLTAQLAPAAHEGQLSVLSSEFKSKDPFKQLIDDDAGPTSSTAPAAATPPPTKTKPDVNLKVVPSTSTAPAGPAAPKVVTPFVSAVISVNGVREGVNVKLDFPTDAPLFHLVSLTKKTAKISVAGGSLASGRHTLTLRRGKALTLVNTADGTRYRLVLVSTSKSTAAAPAQTGTASPTSTTAPPTTTTQTTTTPTIGG